MKPTPFLIVLALLLSALPIALLADESVDIWTQIYTESRTDAARYQIALKIMEFRNKDFTPMIQHSLDDLYNRRIDAGTTTERYDKLQLARLLVQQLGTLNAVDSADRVFNLYNELSDPFLKSDCAIALGKLRATAYAYRLSRDLSDINQGGKDGDTRPQEVIAFGLVQALESMRSPLSFEPLFLASIGWYPNSARVKDAARNAVMKVFEDPSENFKVIIQKNANISVKVSALDAESASKAPAANKAAVSRLSLHMGLDLSSSIPGDVVALQKLRQNAIKMLVALGDKDPDSTAMFIELIRRDRFDDVSMNDTIQAYTALGYNATPDAVKFLNGKLDYYNEGMRSGKNTPRDKMLVREVVAAIKRAKSPDSKNILMKSQYVNEYDNAIIQDIRDALGAIGN